MNYQTGLHRIPSKSQIPESFLPNEESAQRLPLFFFFFWEGKFHGKTREFWDIGEEDGLLNSVGMMGITWESQRCGKFQLIPFQAG